MTVYLAALSVIRRARPHSKVANELVDVMIVNPAKTRTTARAERFGTEYSNAAFVHLAGLREVYPALVCEIKRRTPESFPVFFISADSSAD